MRILHIEDSPKSTAALRRFSDEWEVESAETVDEARDLLSEESFDLVLVSRRNVAASLLNQYGIPVVVTSNPVADMMKLTGALGQVQVRRKSLSFQGLASVKPYLSCAVLA